MNRYLPGEAPLDHELRERICSNCHGSGRDGLWICSACGGRGIVEVEVDSGEVEQVWIELDCNTRDE